MKLVLIAYLHGYGGAEKQIILLANGMVGKGHDVTLISISGCDICFPIDDNIKLIHISNKGKDRVLNIIERYLKLKKILRKIRPDIVINYWYQGVYLCYLMSKKITGKIVYSERGDPGDVEYLGLLGAVRKITLPKVDGVVFQTSAAQKYFNRNIQKKSIVIPNPVFLEIKKSKISNVDRKKKIVGVGRLHPQKNFDLLIEAFSHIVKIYPDYKLEIYGEGELKRNLEAKIRSLNLSGCVILKGNVNNVQAKIYDASLFVLSSKFEGMPNALLEAMIVGLPCISTNWNPGGIEDIITNEENGIIVKNNDVKEMTEAICKVLGDQDFANKLGSKAKNKVKGYSETEVMKEWDEFLSGLLNNQKCSKRK